MKILNVVLVVLVALLSVAAGAAKVMLAPQEVEFLQSFGFTPSLIIGYGVVQVVGGTLLAIPKLRKVGAIVTALAFGVSTILIFIAGNAVFGLISLLPIILIGLVFLTAKQGGTEPMP